MKITGEKVLQFIEGNLKMYADALNVLPKHEKEQVIWRSQICSDCVQVGFCQVCQCSVPGKFYVWKSCNDGERFPDMMEKEEWEEWKIKHDIVIEISI